MKDILLQKKLAMTRLNPSSDGVLEKFLSFTDSHVLMKQPI